MPERKRPYCYLLLTEKRVKEPIANFKPKNNWTSPIPIDSPTDIPFRDFTEKMHKY